MKKYTYLTLQEKQLYAEVANIYNENQSSIHGMVKKRKRNAPQFCNTVATVSSDSKGIVVCGYTEKKPLKVKSCTICGLWFCEGSSDAPPTKQGDYCSSFVYVTISIRKKQRSPGARNKIELKARL